MNHADAFRYGPNASAIVDLDGRLLDVSDRFSEVMGRSRETLLGLSFHDLSSPRERRADEEVLEQLLSGHPPITREKRYVLPNGDEFRALLSVAAVPGADGAPSYFVSTVDRVTVLASQKLERYNAAINGLTRHPGLRQGDMDRFLEHLTKTVASVLQVARVGVWYWGEEPSPSIRLVCATIDGKVERPGTVLTANDYPAYFQAMRTQRVIVADDARSHPATSEFTESYLEPLGITSMLDAPIVIGDRLVGVGCHEHTGDPRAWSADEQTFAGAAASLVSLAEQSATARRAEVELRKLNEELERRVEARTGELEAFSYSVSHDLRAPLRAMGGFARVLMTDYQDQLDDTGRDFLERIMAAANKMGRLIDALLSLSRYSHQPIQLRDVDLREMAGAVAKDLRERDPKRNFEFVCEAPLPCRGDRELLDVLLRNLLENAWKFTTDTVAPKIELGVSPSAEGDLSRTFFVRDNGDGFDQSHAESLFKPFTKLPGAKRTEGTGIGLATVMRIAQRHGGRAWAVATPGEGATFYFSLATDES